VIAILIVDDDKDKRDQVRALVVEMVGDESEVVDASSVAEAAERLRERAFDLMVLDLNLPQRAGEEPRRDGGSRLMEMLKGQVLRKPTHIVGLTAFAELVEKVGPSFSETLWHVVRYEPDTDGWFDPIGRRISYIVDSKTTVAAEGYGCDLAIITALTKVELEAVLALPAAWSPRNLEGDDAEYFVGRAVGEGFAGSLVAAAANEVGMTAACAMTMKLVQQFRPRVLAMTGIAAGVKGRFGDVLVADKAWDYGCGKNRQVKGPKSAFYPQPAQIALHPSLKAKLALFGTKKAVLRGIELGWDGPEDRGALEVRTGGIASGAAVLENKWLMDDIVARDRKVVGVEMEAYGVFMAGLVCSAPRPMAMVVKSICDFGNEMKNDEYQRYAAYTSARFVWEFAKDSLWATRTG
jgi:nucleoside phosphorylase/CheY-like chemotaxis protein